MRSGIISLLTIFVAWSCILSLQACHRMSATDRQVAPDRRLAAVTDSVDGELWQTDDVTLRYKVADNGDTLDVSGELMIADSVLYTFPIVRFFRLYVVLLDDQGRLLAQEEIGPVLSKWNSFREPARFSSQVAKPRELDSIAFSYWGVFRQSGGDRPRLGGDEWELYYSPFAQ